MADSFFRPTMRPRALRAVRSSARHTRAIQNGCPAARRCPAEQRAGALPAAPFPLSLFPLSKGVKNHTLALIIYNKSSPGAITFSFLPLGFQLSSLLPNLSQLRVIEDLREKREAIHGQATSPPVSSLRKSSPPRCAARARPRGARPSALPPQVLREDEERRTIQADIAALNKRWAAPPHRPPSAPLPASLPLLCGPGLLLCARAAPSVLRAPLPCAA